MKSINDLIQSAVEEKAAIGAAVAILQGGEIVFTDGFGLASVELPQVKVTPHTLFAYGSISKNICGALIMRLVEKGLLRLDTPIVHYLPDLRFSQNEAYGRQITLRHILSHTSGLPMAGKYWGPRDPDSLRRSVYEQVAHFAFLAEPGAIHLYSNMVFCLAGHIAEAVTGRFYDDLVQEYLFDPLQMRRTTFDLCAAITYSLALPHESDPDGQLHLLRPLPDNGSGHPSSFALGPIADLANLARMYLNQGQFDGGQFLTAASIAEMQRLHASRRITSAAHPLAHPNGGFGLAFNVGRYKGRRVARHGGMTPGYNCFFDLFPDDRAGVVALTTYLPEHEGRLVELVAALYDYALELPHEGVVYLDKPKAISLDADQLRPYGGDYLNVETANLATFLVVDGKLTLQRGEEILPLIPIGNDEFYAQVSETYRLSVAFLFNSDGKAAHALIGGQPYHPIALDPAFTPDSRLWRSFAGVYKDPSNMDKADILTVRPEDTVLYIAEGDYEVAAKAIDGRCFLSKLGLIEFEDAPAQDLQILIRGKATRYYPLAEQEYRANGVIRYLVDVPPG
ncbi:MAG: beta-lactamase family protein [Anaerolinea sp.]|nr:beta-lactamase family protein [Anaerolinea sp.]